MRFLISRPLVGLQIPTFGQLVLQKNKIAGPLLAGSQPNPGRRDLLIRVERARNDRARVIVFDRLLLNEQVIFHLRYFFSAETGLS